MPHWPPTPPRWAPQPRPETSDERAVTFVRRRAGPFNISLRAYRSDFEQREHAHPLALIDLNLAGGGVGRCGVERRESSPGEIEAYAPEVPHCFRSGPRGIRTMHVSLAQHDLDLAAEAGLCGGVANRRFDGAAALRHGVTLLEMSRRDGAWEDERAEAAAWGLYGVVFARSARHPDSARAAAPAWFATALELLHANLDRAVGIDELARECRVHRGTLMRGFAAHLGTTPAAYHRGLRTAHAAKALAQGASAAEAALLAGFADQPHLTRLMRATCGTTPGAFASAIGVGHRSKR